MPMYEYLIKVEYTSVDAAEWMNDLGLKGWELVCVINEPGNKYLLRYYFKKYL